MFNVRSLLLVSKGKHIMGKQKTKLGARILSEEELNAILPNANSVDEQIDVFRDSIPKDDRKEDGKQFELDQKTNCIGIIGHRGTGKTSILKTFYHNQKENSVSEQQKCKDVILPIIIPENMSSGTTLMDAVLGRLKSIVEERENAKNINRYSDDCIYSGQNNLEKQYNELVKQYCYIKKDYRDILIQQFTTEQNYVDKTKKVFSSDSEFLKIFNDFLRKLLARDADTENSMLFLFIDDIDLSTNRCMDIVRTLLVYLSNPRIVTFISGDIETFEEELTLEFLRQESALQGDVFRETYYTDNTIGSSLLERKKTLAYEYLKKIMPPAYRRSIRYWTLEERGNYMITETESNEQKTLSELLVEVTKERLGELYFVYKDDEKRKHMKLAFHMFDDTSRGLNNVYNVLQEIYDLQKSEKNITADEKKLFFWRLIETIVDSKPLYAKYKSELLKHVIVLGQGQITIDFTNAYQLLYGEKPAERTVESENTENGNRVKSFSPTECFAIYFLIDFAANLFSSERHSTNSKYDDLKRRIIQDYLRNEEIDDKIPASLESLDCLEKRPVDKNIDSANSILINLLTTCDFIFILHLIRCLGRVEIYKILKNTKRSLDKESAYKIAYALSRAVQSLNESEESIREYLADLYIQMPELFITILNHLSLNPWIIYGRQMINSVNILYSLRFMSNETNLADASFMNIENHMNEGSSIDSKMRHLLWASYESEHGNYWIYYEKELRETQPGRVALDIKAMEEETVLAGLTKSVMNQLQDLKIIDQYEVRALKEINYDNLLAETAKEEKEIQVIQEIDKQELWTRVYVKRKIFPYLRSEKAKIIYRICNDRQIYDATQLIEKGAYYELEKCYKGSSGTALIYGLETKIQQVMFLSMGEIFSESIKFFDGRFYLRLEQVLIIQCLLKEFLHIHRAIIYGKKEARKLLMEMKELPLVLHTSDWNKIDVELQSREYFFFNKRLDFSRNNMEDEIDQDIIEKIRKEFYTRGNTTQMKEIIEKQLNKFGANNYLYIQQLIQKEQLKKLESELSNSLIAIKKSKKEWINFEPIISEKKVIFFFHSYLRYLQENDNDAETVNSRAKDIVTLAEYMLDSEIKADEMLQNEIYQIISEDMEITEDEFETLF